jgi:hypothetical protein
MTEIDYDDPDPGVVKIAEKLGGVGHAVANLGHPSVIAAFAMSCAVARDAMEAPALHGVWAALVELADATAEYLREDTES